MAENILRIAMWSGPRNISTAMMRAFENRSDTVVVDEPFYAHYLAKTGYDHPGSDTVLSGQSQIEDEVITDLLAPLPDGKSIFYQKHMGQHLLDGMRSDWFAELTHTFLIRDPAAILASYVKQREEVSLLEIGLPQQQRLFDEYADKFGKAPPVIDTADVLKDPKGKLEKLCEAVGVPFDDAMLSWPEGKRDTDGVWAPWWYENVEKTTGFAPYKHVDVELEERLKPIAEAAQPYYEHLAQYRL